MNSTVDSSNLESPQGAVHFFSNLKVPGCIEIAIQSILDALDLWISSLKYYFDALNPGNAGLSSKLFLEWLASEEGLIIFLLGAVFFGLFAYLGNGIKKENANLLSQTADTYWPYVRDVIKRLKWTFKGTRSLLFVLQNLNQQNYTTWITPIGIVIGLIAVVNQLWNRSMIETRKSLQQANELFAQQVRGIDAYFLEIDEQMLGDQEHQQQALQYIYSGCLLLLNQPGGHKTFCWIDEKGQKQAMDDDLKNFLQKKLQGLNRLDNECYQTMLNESKGKLNENDWNLLNTIGRTKTTFLQNKVVHDDETRRYLFTAAQFQNNSTTAYASATLNGIMNAPYYFLGVLSMVSLPSSFLIYAVVACSFFMLLNVVSEYDQEAEYQRRLKISQLKANFILHQHLLLQEEGLEIYNELRVQMHLSVSGICRQSLRNGLVIYGAFNSLLMTIASMSFLFGLNITATFFYVSILVGIFLLIASIAYTLMYIHPKKLMDAQQAVDDIRNLPEIQGSVNLLIPEHAEVARQMLSGTKKGIKSTQILFSLWDSLVGGIDPIFNLAYLAACLSYAYFFALKGIKGLMRVDNEGYKESFLYCQLTSTQRPSQLALNSI